MIIKRWKPIKFVINCLIMFRDDELERAIRWYSKRPVAPTKKIFQWGRYPAVSIYDKKIHVHRLLLMYKLRRELERWEYAHHIDNCTSNALMKNIELQVASEHQRYVNLGRKQTAEHINNRINATCLTRYGHTYENPELLQNNGAHTAPK